MAPPFCRRRRLSGLRMFAISENAVIEERCRQEFTK